jgi:hypothetical protein
MMRRISIGQSVGVIDSNSMYYGRIGLVVKIVPQPVGMSLKNHIVVKLESTGREHIFLPEQLKVIKEESA